MVRSFKILCFVFLLAAFCSDISCGVRSKRPQLGRSYPQDFYTSTALLIKERNGVPLIIASAFIIDKQKGLFASAKHFIGLGSGDHCKIFFNGKIYGGFLLTVPPVADVSIIKIDGNFNSSDFPEPYKIAKEVKVGDKVFIRGFHPHPSQLQEDHKVVSIMRRYYGYEGRNDEFVYDDLPATVVNTNFQTRKEQTNMPSEMLAKVTSRYIRLKAAEDHQFSFGGLSGGPTVNERGELVGINSTELTGYLELMEKGLVYHPFVNLFLVPTSELEKMMPQLENIR